MSLVTIVRLFGLGAMLLLSTGCACHRGPLDCLFSGCDTGCDTGCSTSCGHGCKLGGEVYQGCGCGEVYHGDWKSHPPSAHPCDCHGNYTGQACSNPSCKHLNAHCSTGCADGCANDCGCGPKHHVGKMHTVLHANQGCASCGN